MSADTHDENALVCPYCGHRHTEAWEMRLDSPAVVDCENEDCAKKFNAWAERSVTYRGKPIEASR